MIGKSGADDRCLLLPRRPSCAHPPELCLRLRLPRSRVACGASLRASSSFRIGLRRRRSAALVPRSCCSCAWGMLVPVGSCCTSYSTNFGTCAAMAFGGAQQARSRCRCGMDGPSPGADVAEVAFVDLYSPVMRKRASALAAAAAMLC
jgi:hypothetical protein